MPWQALLVRPSVTLLRAGQDLFSAFFVSSRSCSQRRCHSRPYSYAPSVTLAMAQERTLQSSSISARSCTKRRCHNRPYSCVLSLCNLAHGKGQDSFRLLCLCEKQYRRRCHSRPYSCVPSHLAHDSHGVPAAAKYLVTQGDSCSPNRFWSCERVLMQTLNVRSFGIACMPPWLYVARNSVHQTPSARRETLFRDR